MQNFDLIENEVLQLNQALLQNFNSEDLFLMKAGIDEIMYGFYKHALIFIYHSESTGDGKKMDLKDVRIRILYDPMREYRINQIINFLESDYQYLGNENLFPSLIDTIEKIKSLYSLLKKENNYAWEIKFKSFLKDENNNYI